MNKQKIGILVLAGAVVLTMGMALGDDSAWKYDTSRRTEIVPSSASASIPGIDTRCREADISSARSIDKWHRASALSNAIDVSCQPTGSMVIVR